MFPSDNPIQDLVGGGTVQAQPVGTHRTYVYTDVFGMCCRGYVRALNFCYRTGNSESEELMTIEIRGPGNSGVRDNYTVMVNSMRDRANCTQRYNLDHTDCCVEQTLSESFKVDNDDNFYALRIPTTPSLLLHQTTETVAGYWEDRFGNEMQGPMINKPLFYFVIDPSDGRLGIASRVMIMRNFTQVTVLLLHHPSLKLQQTIPLRVVRWTTCVLLTRYVSYQLHKKGFVGSVLYEYVYKEVFSM